MTNKDKKTFLERTNKDYNERLRKDPEAGKDYQKESAVSDQTALDGSEEDQTDAIAAEMIRNSNALTPCVR